MAVPQHSVLASLTTTWVGEENVSAELAQWLKEAGACAAASHASLTPSHQFSPSESGTTRGAWIVLRRLLVLLAEGARHCAGVARRGQA